MRQGRWLEFYNNGLTTVPAFAPIKVISARLESGLLPGGSPSRMLLSGSQPSEGTGPGQEISDDPYDSYDPDDPYGPTIPIEYYTSSLEIAINGEIPVLPGAKGLCTFESPALGLIRNAFFFLNSDIPIDIEPGVDYPSQLLTIAVPVNGSWVMQPLTHDNSPEVEFNWTDRPEPGGVTTRTVYDAFRIVCLTDHSTTEEDALVAVLMREDRI